VYIARRSNFASVLKAGFLQKKISEFKVEEARPKVQLQYASENVKNVNGARAFVTENGITQRNVQPTTIAQDFATLRSCALLAILSVVFRSEVRLTFRLVRNIVA
jgi:hypothetical protein